MSEKKAPKKTAKKAAKKTAKKAAKKAAPKKTETSSKKAAEKPAKKTSKKIEAEPEAKPASKAQPSEEQAGAAPTQIELIDMQTLAKQLRLPLLRVKQMVRAGQIPGVKVDGDWKFNLRLVQQAMRSRAKGR